MSTFVWKQVADLVEGDQVRNYGNVDAVGPYYIVWVDKIVRLQDAVMVRFSDSEHAVKFLPEDQLPVEVKEEEK